MIDPTCSGAAPCAHDFCPDAPDGDAAAPCAPNRHASDFPYDSDQAVRLANFVQTATDANRAFAIRSFCQTGFTITLPTGDGHRSVTIPFRINGDDFAPKLRRLTRLLGGSPAARCAAAVVCGRPTPDQLKRVVSELARRDPAAFAPDKTRSQIRAYLSDLGIGIDCAGTVAQAFYACHGVDESVGRRRFGLRALHDGIFAGIDKNLAFEKIGDPSAVRPGDIIVLDPPSFDYFGHKVIVVDKRIASLDGFDSPVVLISVMSSWGHEGPAERTWVYDPSTGSWSDRGGSFTDGTPFQSPASGPWDHPLRGIYHAR